MFLTGRVADNHDPESLGRIQITFDGFDSDLASHWLRVMQPYAHGDYGSYLLPEVDQQVLVVCIKGDLAGGIVLGCLYNGKAMPLADNVDPDNYIKEFRTKAGNRITIDDTSGAEMITIANPDDETQIVMDNGEGSILIQTTATITLEVPDGDIIANCTTATVTASDSVTVECTDATVEASNSVSVTGSSKVEISGAQINITGDSKVAVSAPSIALG